jgi:hypothetical protein
MYALSRVLFTHVNFGHGDRCYRPWKIVLPTI